MTIARSAVALIAGAVCALTVKPAAADDQFSQEFSDEIPLQVAPWDGTFTIPRFDPALGVLERVDLAFEVDFVGQARFENLDDVPALFNLQLSWQTTWVISDAAPNVSLTLDGGRSRGGRASPFDGEQDFGGFSGATFDFDFTESISDSTTDAAVLSVFTGAGDLVMPVETFADSFVADGDDFVAEFDQSAAARATVIYTYVPEPSAAIALGLPLVLVLRRWQR